MDLKEKLLKEVASELGVSEDVCAKIINHQFNAVRLFIHNNPVGEVHIPRIGKLVSTQENYDRFQKKMQERRDKESLELQGA